MSLAVGDYVVYPSQGVGRVKSVEQREVAGQLASFFLVQVLSTEVQILIPTSKINTCGLRPVMEADNTAEVLAIFDEAVRHDSGVSWIRKSRRYEESLSRGLPLGVAEVLRDLSVMKLKGQLSFGQLRMLERSRRMIFSELSLAMGLAEEAVEQGIMERIQAANSRGAQGRFRSVRKPADAL